MKRIRFLEMAHGQCRIAIALAMLLTGWLLPAGRAAGAPQSQRLVFKDGSVESVEYYRVEGARVIFKSPEREEEIIPLDRVDLAATKKANADPAPAPGSKRRDVRIYSKEEREAAGGKEGLIRHLTRQTPEGVDLPEPAGVYVFINGQFLRLPESDVALQKDKLRKIGSLVGVPTRQQKQTATLAGPKSAVRFKTGSLTFYVDLADTTPARLQIVRLMSKGDHREMAEILVDLRGQVEMKQQAIPITARALDNGLIQLKPAQPLPPGEYALMERAPSNPLQTGSVAIEKKVWDFGVDPRE